MVIASLAGGCALGLAIASVTGTSPSDAASAREVPQLPTPTVQVEKQQLAEVVRAACEPDQLPTSITPGQLGDGPLVVTEVGVEPGDVVETGTLLAQVSGHPLVAVVTEVPLYRDLALGDVGDDVERLEAALVEAGLLAEADAVFDADTAAAMVELYDRAGVDPANVGVATDEFNLALSHSLAPGSTVAQVLAGVGDEVEPGDALATIGGPDAAVVCTLNASVPVSADDDVELAVDGQTLAATVTSVGQTDGESQQRPVVVVPDDPATAMDGPVELRFVTDATQRDVPTVPVGALFTSPSGDLSVRKVMAETVEAVPVEIGLMAGGFVEILGDGLSEGDEVQVQGRGGPSDNAEAQS